LQSFVKQRKYNIVRRRMLVADGPCSGNSNELLRQVVQAIVFYRATNL
jgi:hypothetical protein